MKNITKFYPEIERLAYDAKLSGLDDAKKKKAYNDLGEYVLKAKGFNAFVTLENAEDEPLENLPAYTEYSGVVVAECIKYAYDTFGKLDKQTGELIPFMRLFNYAMSKKHNEIWREKKLEKDGINMKCREAALKLFLDGLAKAKGLKDWGKRINLSNRDKVEKCIYDMGYGEDTFKEACKIMDYGFAVVDEVLDPESGDTQGFCSDEVAYKQFKADERGAEAFADVVEESLNSTTKRTIVDGIKDIATLVYAGYDVGMVVNKLLIEEYVDTSVLEAVKEAGGFENAVSFLADYHGVLKETERKTVCNALKAMRSFAK